MRGASSVYTRGVSFPRPIVDAASYGLRFRSLVEIGFIVLVFMTGAAVAASEYRLYTARTQLAESIALFAGLKVNLGAFYGQTGRWPSSEDEKNALILEAGERGLGAYVQRIDIADEGVLLARFHEGSRVSELIENRVVAFRPVTNVADPSAPLTWSCGYWLPPEGMTVSPDNPTTVDERLLPFVCREQSHHD